MARDAAGMRCPPPARSAHASTRGAWVLALALALAGTAQADQPRRVLLLNSYHIGYGWTDRFVTAARESLTRELRGVEVYVEYLDTKRKLTPTYLDLFRRILLEKYAEVPLDAILSSDDDALRFLLGHHAALFPGVPVVFSGVDDHDPALLRGQPDFTGVIEVMDFEQTIDLALRLHPGTTRVAIISDGTVTGRGQRRGAAATATQFPRLTFEYLNGEELTHANLLTRLRALSRQTVVLLLVWLQDKDGTYIPYEEGYAEICAAAPVPVYAVSDTWLGLGIVGGKLNSGRIQGEQAAAMAVRILRDGVPPAEIPVQTENPNVYMFDWRQLERFGIDVHRLPAGSVIINQPPTLYGQYRALIWTGGTVIAVLLVTVVVLLIAMAQRRRAERAARESQNFLQVVLDSIQVRVFWKDLESVYLGCNWAAAMDAGLKSPAEIVGKVDGELAWSAQAELYRADDRSVIQSGLPKIRYEEPQTWPDGTTRWLRTSKVPLKDAQGNIIGLLGSYEDITEPKRAQAEIERLQSLLMAAIEQSPAGVLVADAPDVRIRMANAAALGMRGESSEPLTNISLELHPRHWQTFHLDGRPCRPDELPLSQAVLYGKTSQNVEVIIRRADGEDRWVLANAAPVRNTQGDIVAGVVMLSDITDRKRAEAEREKLEAQLRHAQKMEAVGRLAGGVAHDFNNILTAILANIDTVRTDLERFLPADNALFQSLDQMDRASQRAAALTRQLLMFSRRDVIRPEVIDLNRVVIDLEKMLRRLLGEHVQLIVHTGARQGRIRADIGQIEQVIMNLVVNARDAMPDGGQITLATADTIVDDEYVAAHSEAQPGPHVVLTVTDTGCGMSRQTLERIFEPFFTTKPLGQGTGLGLATVYGIVHQSGGHLRVDSEIRKGTTFRVYLPTVIDALTVVGGGRDGPCATTGTETILVCEDDDNVRELAASLLRAAGYQVLVAENGTRALRLAQEHHGPIHLLLCDVIMPDLNGREVADRLRTLRPETRTLFISGYTSDVIAHHGVLADGVELLEKPFGRPALLRRVRALLDRTSA